MEGRLLLVTSMAALLCRFDGCCWMDGAAGRVLGVLIFLIKVLPRLKFLLAIFLKLRVALFLLGRTESPEGVETGKILIASLTHHNHLMLVTDWLITRHVTYITSSDWLATLTHHNHFHRSRPNSHPPDHTHYPGGYTGHCRISPSRSGRNQVSWRLSGYPVIPQVRVKEYPPGTVPPTGGVTMVTVATPTVLVVGVQRIRSTPTLLAIEHSEHGVPLSDGDLLAQLPDTLGRVVPGGDNDGETRVCLVVLCEINVISDMLQLNSIENFNYSQGSTSAGTDRNK
eukprot:sb/3467784/